MIGGIPGDGQCNAVEVERYDEVYHIEQDGDLIALTYKQAKELADLLEGMCQKQK